MGTTGSTAESAGAAGAGSTEATEAAQSEAEAGGRRRRRLRELCSPGRIIAAIRGSGRVRLRGLLWRASRPLNILTAPHLEDAEVLDQLARTRGEVTGYQLADAPMTLAGEVGDRFGGLLACLVLCTFR